MGVRLVGEALRPDWCILSDRARLVLVQMCYVARDRATADTAAGLYFGGQPALIHSVLGLDMESLSPSELDTARQLIKRAVKELRDAGAITLLSHPAKGQKAVYQVHPNHYPNLQQEALPVDNSPTPTPVGGHPRTPLGGHPRTPYPGFRGSPTYPLRGSPTYPLNHLYREETKEDLKENHPTQPTAQLWPDAPSDLWITR